MAVLWDGEPKEMFPPICCFCLVVCCINKKSKYKQMVPNTMTDSESLTEGGSPKQSGLGWPNTQVTLEALLLDTEA